jgi:hypothetical protein
MRLILIEKSLNKKLFFPNGNTYIYPRSGNQLYLFSISINIYCLRQINTLIINGSKDSLISNSR